MANQNSKLWEITKYIFQCHIQNLKRRKESFSTRLRIGHTKLTHGYLVARGIPPICKNFGTTLSIKRVLSKSRRYLFNILHDLNASLGSHLDFNEQIINFFKSAYLYKEILSKFTYHIKKNTNINLIITHNYNIIIM